MQDPTDAIPKAPRREPWNKGKLVGAKPPLRSKHVWSIRTKLQNAGRTRDLAMFNLAIDSKLRGCDVSGQYPLSTAERSVFRLLITGADDSAVVVNPRTFRSAQGGKIEVLDEMIAALD